MIKLDKIVIVEGKYDKITLENVIDATFVVTNGFGLYKDNEKQKLIKRLCKKHGAVIITDSDNAGNQIRGFIKNICGNENIINVYLPQILGKERRKKTPSKQGFLGAEGMDKNDIIDALNKSGVLYNSEEKKENITKCDLYNFGLSGKSNSRQCRESFSDFISLPRGLSTNAFLDALNSIFTVSEFNKEAKKWLQEQGKNLNCST